jgi:hypothetical protein
VDLPTYTNIWRIEKRLYKLYDFRLPAPLPISWIAVFAGITVPYIVFLVAIGLPFNHDLVWLYVLPPGVLTWLTTRPVIENKRLPELLVSQVRYLAEPRAWCRMAPLAEKDEIVVVAKVWHSRRVPAQRKADVVARRDRGTVATRAVGNGRAAARPLIPQPDMPAPAAPPLVLERPSPGAPVRARAVARGGGPGRVGRVEVAHGDAAMGPATPSSFDGLPPGPPAQAGAPAPQTPPAETGALPAGAAPRGAGDAAADFAVDLTQVPGRETGGHQTRHWFEGVRGPTTVDAPAWVRADDEAGTEDAASADVAARDEDDARDGYVAFADDGAGANDWAVAGNEADADDETRDDGVAAPVEADVTGAAEEVEAEAAAEEVEAEAEAEEAEAEEAEAEEAEAEEVEAEVPPSPDVVSSPAVDAVPPSGAIAPGTPAKAPAPTPEAPAAAPRTPVVPVTVVRALSRDRDRAVPSIERALARPGRNTTDGLGWRRKVKVVAGTSQGPGKRDQEALDRDRARLPLAGPKRVLVLGCTSGAGQTVTALMTGYILASLREHPVAAVDLHDGGLARHANPVGRVKDLLSGAVPDARPMTAPDGLKPHARKSKAPLDVIVSDGEPLGEADVTTLARILAEHYPLVMLDPGPNGLPRLLHIADQLVLVAPASAEAAQSLAGTRDWLDAHGFGDLVAHSVTLINGASRRSMADVELAESVARGRCRAIVRVPWDDQLPVGAAGPSALLPQTRVAYTALAGVVIAGLAAAPVRAR